MKINTSKIIKNFIILLILIPLVAVAGTCDQSWDGDKIISKLAGSSSNASIKLVNNSYEEKIISLKEIEAFYNALIQIQKQVGLNPKFTICGESSPNAFATNINGAPVLGVTYGMLKIVHGDQDMAAMVVAHEMGHHAKNHMLNGQKNRFLVNVITSFVGAYADYRLGRVRGYNRPNINIGRKLAIVGGALVNAKFSRDDEREADELAFKYMVHAGFNPKGALKLSNQMKTDKDSGLFLSTHPSWTERSSRLEDMIAKSPEAQKIISNSELIESVNETPIKIASFDADYSINDSQKLIQNAINAFEQNDIKSAVQFLRNASDMNDPFAQAFLGTIYHSGQGVPKNQIEAVRLYKKAASQGLAWAQVNLAHAYEKGNGVEQDYNEAIKLYNLALEEEPRAKADLGYMYLIGSGVDIDLEKGGNLIKDAADAGDGMGYRHLGYMYQFGIGLSKNLTEAAKYYRLGSEQKNGLSATALGNMYESGNGVDQSYEEAFKLYKLAESLEDSSGRFYLGNLYFYARGVKKDLIEAVRLFKLSAEDGFPYAQTMLGYCLLNGKGISKNKDEAILWLKISAANDEDEAKKILKNMGI